MPSRRDSIGLRKLALAVWLAALLQAFAQPVRAEVRVSGQADAVIVETREASVEEVLAALRASFNLRYRTSGALNRAMTGTYTGSLQRVIARLLEGHNYVLQSSAGGGELIVIGPGVAGSSVTTSRHQVVADAGHQELPGPPRSPDVHEGGATTSMQALPPLPNATLGAVMPPVPIATATGDVPAFPAVNTSLMPPPAPTPEFSFGPPIISLPSGLVGPIPQPAPTGSASP